MNIPDKFEPLVLEALAAYEMVLKDEAYRTISQPNAERLRAKSDELEGLAESIENGECD